MGFGKMGYWDIDNSAEAQPGIMKAEAGLGGYKNILFLKKR